MAKSWVNGSCATTSPAELRIEFTFTNITRSPLSTNHSAPLPWYPLGFDLHLADGGCKLLAQLANACGVRCWSVPRCTRYSAISTQSIISMWQNNWPRGELLFTYSTQVTSMIRRFISTRWCSEFWRFSRVANYKPLICAWVRALSQWRCHASFDLMIIHVNLNKLDFTHFTANELILSPLDFAAWKARRITY